MILLPIKYAWLAGEHGPRMLTEALKLYGVKETVGTGNNPEIMSWADECGIKYDADVVPWCGLFAAVVAHRAKKPIPGSPLWARSWALWGSPAPVPSLADVLVFLRGNGGHVGLYVGEDIDCFHVLGGNQGDTVSIARINRSRLIAARRHYPIGTPPNVRPIKLDIGGEVSVNEA